MIRRKVIIWCETAAAEHVFWVVDDATPEQAGASRRDLWSAINAESRKNAEMDAYVRRVMGPALQVMEGGVA